MTKFFSLFAVAIFLMSGIALGQETVQEPNWIVQGGFADLFNSWPEIGKLLAFMFSLMAVLRTVAELLTRVSAWLDTKSPAKAWLQKLSAWASELAWLLGVVLGKVGVGEPKLVTAEKIAQATAKPEVK